MVIIKTIVGAFIAVILTMLALYIIACFGISCYKAIKKQLKDN